ncbi:hypothetical protein [Parvibium lacunae]|uniref:Uncharacterized protein n=1 Tax=Parvibium lacunae TaxID=1888893 RepID=A0A368L1T5_9BURK|nr:hypothetical protein [Parvibium lacunae]RCS57472.1 hypothetical protein DU000_08445 [Parvibium lacunae]
MDASLSRFSLLQRVRAPFLFVRRYFARHLCQPQQRCLRAEMGLAPFFVARPHASNPALLVTISVSKVQLWQLTST